MSKNIEVPRDRVAEFCSRHHLRKLSLFGSVLRDDFGPDSDVDVLVEFEPEHTPGFFGLFAMERELGEILGGRQVEINTARSLSPYFRDEVLAQAEVQYVEA